MAGSDMDSTRERINRLAWLLDSSIPIPGLKFRIGIDALIGLIPGIGDAVGVLLSSYIVREAARAGLPKSILARMVLNVAIEGVVGMIPFAGDLFDAVWKANQRNAALLNAYLENPHRTTKSSRAFVFGMIAALVGMLVATSVAGFFVLRWVWQAVGG
jgi:hypothetical protein